MHKSFVFPLNCFSPQIPLEKPQVLETELGLFVYDESINVSKAYEAFDTIEIIPSLIQLVEKIERVGESWGYWKENDKNVKLVLSWMKKWGYLKARKEPDLISKEFYGERLSGFLQEAVKFYKLWNLYKAVANRELHTLENLITVYEGELEDVISFTENNYIFHFYGSEFFQGEVQGEFDRENPLKSYQRAAITYLTRIIEEYINNNSIYSSEIKHVSLKEKDAFKVVPALAFPNLLDALYMQFFILLNENEKKICPVCNQPFSADRIDQKYCSDACKSTAKSRRYRARKKAII